MVTFAITAWVLSVLLWSRLFKDWGNRLSALGTSLALGALVYWLVFGALADARLSWWRDPQFWLISGLISLWLAGILGVWLSQQGMVRIGAEGAGQGSSDSCSWQALNGILVLGASAGILWLLWGQISEILPALQNGL